MNDYLEKTCVNLGIKLMYTNNKVVVLSAEDRDSFLIIRAHKLFKGCPHLVAQAVIGYYTDKDNVGNHKKVLEDFILQKFSSNKFKIKPLNYDLKKIVNQPAFSEVNADADNLLLTEFHITSMVVKDFSGKEQSYTSDNWLKPSSNDILELDIIVKPPVT